MVTPFGPHFAADIIRAADVPLALMFAGWLLAVAWRRRRHNRLAEVLSALTAAGLVCLQASDRISDLGQPVTWRFYAGTVFLTVGFCVAVLDIYKQATSADYAVAVNS